MPRAFDIFLSHNSGDTPAVEELGNLLKQRGLTVWLDKWELVPGRPWQEALEEVIDTTRSAAVLVGSEGIGPWQRPEMRAAPILNGGISNSAIKPISALDRQENQRLFGANGCAAPRSAKAVERPL